MDSTSATVVKINNLPVLFGGKTIGDWTTEGHYVTIKPHVSSYALESTSFNGDLENSTSTSLEIQVGGLRGKVIAPTQPADKDSLTFDFDNLAWIPNNVLGSDTAIGGNAVSVDYGSSLGVDTYSSNDGVSVGTSAYSTHGAVAIGALTHSTSGSVVLGWNSVGVEDSVSIGSSTTSLKGGIALGTGATAGEGKLSIAAFNLLNQTEPVDKITPAAWLTLTLNATEYKIPLYQ
jgi:hypothetical protein